MCLKCGHTTVNPYKIPNYNNTGNTTEAVLLGLTGVIGQLLNGNIWTCYAADQNSNGGGGGTTVKSSKETEEVNDKKEEKEDPTKLKKEVVDILEKEKITVSNEILDEVIKKYTVMKNFNSGKFTLEQRVANYAKALSNYGKVEESFGKNDKDAVYNIAGVEEAITDQSMEKYKAAFNNAADEYIELHDDKSGDGRISFVEYIAKETDDAQINVENLSDSEAKTKFAAEYIAFQALDLDRSGYLEKNEVAGMINWTAVQDNDGKNITYNDNQSFGEDLANYVMATLELDEADTKQFIEYINADNRGAALALLKEKTNLTEDDFANIVNAFEGYTEAVKAFTEA